jgi:hypothetical protein
MFMAFSYFRVVAVELTFSHVLKML